MLRRTLPKKILRLQCHRCKSISATTVDEISYGDICNNHIVSSPFPSIQQGPYGPLAEFVMKDWSRWVANDPKKIAMTDVSTGQVRTFADYEKDTTRIAGALHHEFNVDQDSTIAVFSPNHVDYLPLVLGTSLTGGKLAPINPLFTHYELEKLLSQSKLEPKILAVHASKLDTALQAVKSCQFVEQIVVIPEHDDDDGSLHLPEGVMSLSDLKKDNHKPLTETLQPQEAASASATQTFLLTHSSGTTGLPKIVCLSHDNLIANLFQCELAEASGFPPHYKLITPLPFFHIYGFLASLAYCGWKGQQLITMSGRFDFELFCKTVQEHQPERAQLVPPILVGLAKSPLVDQYDLSSLKVVLSAAAPLGKETEDDVKNRLTGCKIKQGWGMSELSPIGTLASDESIVSGSVGPVVASTQGKILDPETGKSLPPNERGELMIRGPQVMQGYLNQPELNAKTISGEGGWLRTGDIAYYDENGFFFICDRLKELIKVRGYQVAPAELEALLLTHESILDAAVIQVQDEQSGELPLACVVLKNNSTTTAQDIQQWVKERVAPYKRLEGGVVFVDSVPKSASGKILRRQLRDVYGTK